MRRHHSTGGGNGGMKLAPEPDGFSNWWAFWRPHMRHTDGKSDARAAYTKALLRGAMPEDLMDGAQGYIRFMAEKDKPYIQLSQTWLNKDRWEDWIDKEREHQANLARLADRTNIVSIKAAPLPANHFSRKYAEGKS
jgi:hypothetical protein